MIIASAKKHLETLLAQAGINDVIIAETTLPVLDAPLLSVTMRGVSKTMIHDFTISVHHLVRELTAAEHKLPATDIPVLVDFDNALLSRVRELETLSKVLMSRATALGIEVHAEPMTALERKVLHTLLQQYPQITTESQGEGPQRHIVIKAGN